MRQAIITIRVFFFLLCLAASGLIAYAVPEWHDQWQLALIVGACLGGLVILVDMLLRGFSLRGFTALSFGIFMGWVIALMISNSPFFEVPLRFLDADPVVVQNAYLIRMALFLVLMYLGAMVALRARDDFNLIIPYVRFVPHGVQVPLVVVDTSALIDGRIVGLCESRFMGYALVIPRFVIDELQAVADSGDPGRRARGRKGLASLNDLRAMKHIDLRIDEANPLSHEKVDAKLVYLAKQLKAKLLTTDYNLSQVAEFQGVEWLNLGALAKALSPEIAVGETLEVALVKPGRDADQAVGYLNDGSMVVVNRGRPHLGQLVQVEVESILPSAGGRMIFCRLVEREQSVSSLA